MILEELDYQKTPLGELILRRRRSPNVHNELVYEVKLGDEMLMSSSVNESEKALARLAIDRWGNQPCDVLIGGLGLGYTAAAALEYAQVRRVDVVELLAPVIQWHRDRLVPAAAALIEDGRCAFIEGDFFELMGRSGLEAEAHYHVILLDIDHSPESHLHRRHAQFYTTQQLRRLHDHLHPGGVFALWSADEPLPDFLQALREVFHSVLPQVITFSNPHIGRSDDNWVILCERSGKPSGTT